MSTDINDRAEVENRLWHEIGKHGHTVMLGVHTHPMQHFQPMTALVEKERGQIWFFTRTDTELARSIQEGKSAMMVVQNGQTFQACVAGELTLQHDPGRIETYWNPVVAAWYPQGKDDPKLTLLCLDVSDAQVWISQGGPIRFAFEIAGANATGEKPDVGGSRRLDLN
ncbi:MAG TPA: pyridoxamine 5'-phosphate oxidase family protein [Caulobacter sp.]|nr:pyridoxamine 5'-phosphate oxidase family protein [Caulobacter sp.]